MNKEKVKMDERLLKLKREYEAQKRLADESRKKLEEKYPEFFKGDDNEES